MGTVSNARRSWKSAYIVSVLLLYFIVQHQQWEYYNKKLTDRSILWAGTLLSLIHHANYITVDVRLRDQASSLLKVSGSYIFFWNWWRLDFYLWLAGLLLSFCFPTPVYIVLPAKCITHHKSGQLPNYITVKFNQHKVPSGSKVCSLLCPTVRANCRWCRSASIMYEQVVIDASVTIFQFKG